MKIDELLNEADSKQLPRNVTSALQLLKPHKNQHILSIYDGKDGHMSDAVQTVMDFEIEERYPDEEDEINVHEEYAHMLIGAWLRQYSIK